MKDLFVNTQFAFLVWIVAVWALFKLGHPTASRVVWWLLVITAFIDWSVRVIWRRRARRRA